MSKILITGASGFVGRHLAAYLIGRNFDVRCAYRAQPVRVLGEPVIVGAIGALTDWSAALKDCDVIVHLAAHLGSRGAPEACFSEVNDKGTRRLVEQARSSRVRLIINASTIAVVSRHAATTPVDDATPVGNYSTYGCSKLAGEHHLAAFVEGGRHGISLRPPMIYGDDASGSWKLLKGVAASGLPLPLGALKNRRNLLAVDNFVHAIAHLVNLNQNQLSSGSFAVADKEALSTAQIVRLMRHRMGRSAALFPFPPSYLRTVLNILGKESVADSLIGNLEIDSQRFRQIFDWKQPLTAQQAIAGNPLLSAISL